MKQTLLHEIEQLVVQNILWKTFPGVEIYCSYQGNIVLHESFGFDSISGNATILKKNCVFDIASLTKAYITSLAVLQLAEQKFINLNHPISRYLAHFKNSESHFVTIQQLLTHTSGLPAWYPLYENGFELKTAWKKLIEMALENKPGSKMVYSCIGYLLLGEIIRKVSSLSLAQYCRNQIFSKLEKGTIGFKPNRLTPVKKIITTAYCQHRKKSLNGVVHDENAFLFNEEGGNAGVFSDIDGLVSLNDMIFNHGTHNGHCFISEEYFQKWTTNQNSSALEPRGAGWDINNPNAEYKSCGALMPEGAIGHLGFTGTSAWISIPDKIAIIILSNRVNISREANLPQIRLFRPQIHDLLLSHVL